MKKTLLFLTLTASTMFASNGAELLKKNCSECHLLTVPTPAMVPTMEAPAMEAVALHIKMAMQDKKEMQKFIVDYALNPSASKSVCESNKVQRFGVMPTLKGKVDPKELETIAAYILEQYPTPEFSAMIKEIQTNDKLNALRGSPFLINQDGLPHITKLLLQNWDKAKLGLSEIQKPKLLIIRKKTLGLVKKIKKQVTEIETSILNAMSYGDDPKELALKVDELALLKATATKAHLKCISDTIEVLNDEQIAFLLPLSDYGQ